MSQEINYYFCIVFFKKRIEYILLCILLVDLIEKQNAIVTFLLYIVFTEVINWEDNMHELSIASSIVKTVQLEIEKRNLTSVTKIALHVGALTDIVPDSLSFGFEAITKNTNLENTELQIEIVPVKGVCKKCNHNFEVVEFVFVCPSCSSNDISMSQGNELDIAYIEAED